MLSAYALNMHDRHPFAWLLLVFISDKNVNYSEGAACESRGERFSLPFSFQWPDVYMGVGICMHM